MKLCWTLAMFTDFYQLVLWRFSINSLLLSSMWKRPGLCTY